MALAEAPPLEHKIAVPTLLPLLPAPPLEQRHHHRYRVTVAGGVRRSLTRRVSREPLSDVREAFEAALPPPSLARLSPPLQQQRLSKPARLPKDLQLVRLCAGTRCVCPASAVPSPPLPRASVFPGVPRHAAVLVGRRARGGGGGGGAFVGRACLSQSCAAVLTRPQKREPFLASFLYSSVLSHATLPRCLASVLANKLGGATLPAALLYELLCATFDAHPALVAACHADLQAVMERDPACGSYTQCSALCSFPLTITVPKTCLLFPQSVLFFKGFQAIAAHRVAHALWVAGRRPLARSLQSRVSEAFQVDIHPGAVLGPGLMLDHATGITIGETAVVGANVSMLHHVTLGGTGEAEAGGVPHHPHVGDGVVIGAGVSLLGPISVGDGAKIGAGSVVLMDLPPRCTAVGVPARVIGVSPAEADDSVSADEEGDEETDQCSVLRALSRAMDWQI